MSGDVTFRLCLRRSQEFLARHAESTGVLLSRVGYSPVYSLSQLIEQGGSTDLVKAMSRYAAAREASYGSLSSEINVDSAIVGFEGQLCLGYEHHGGRRSHVITCDRESYDDLPLDVALAEWREAGVKAHEELIRRYVTKLTGEQCRELIDWCADTGCLHWTAVGAWLHAAKEGGEV